MPEAKRIYCEMGRVAADAAEAKGSINEETRRKLLELFSA